jgi:hypothetical protein
LGVVYNAALLLYSKIMHSMSERVGSFLFKGKDQIDDAYYSG